MSKEKFYLVLAIIILLSAGTLTAIRFFSGDEDGWLCRDGQWVRHGNPSSPAPAVGCATVPAEGQTVEEGRTDEVVASTTVPVTDGRLLKPEIEVDSPLIGASVPGSFQINGRARGNWYFEASFPIDIVAADGRKLATFTAQAQSDWMTEDFVPFIAQASFSASSSFDGRLVFRKDNPSGEPQFDKSYDLPVVFMASPSATTSELTVKVFFGSEALNPGAEDCSEVFPVERRITKTEGVARAALEELLKGPTAAELDMKYFSSINPGVGIDSLVIASGTALVDFDAEMGRAVGGSCRVAAIRSQVTRTLKQFPTVKEVLISVDGSIEEALQP